jgi:hypothetical protein
MYNILKISLHILLGVYDDEAPTVDMITIVKNKKNPFSNIIVFLNIKTEDIFFVM